MGFFKKLVKGIGKVAKKSIVGTIARTVVGSVPILGGVVSAVGAVKSSLHPPTVANTGNLSSVTGRPAFGHPGIMQPHRTRAPRPRTARRPTRRAVGGAKRKRAINPGGTAKQRAARARFAAAAKRGRIKKGSHL